MKKILLSLLSVFAALNTSAATITLADPTIFYDDGVYYLTGTYAGSGFTMYQSTDLIHWTACGNAANGMALSKDDVFGTSGFWAPQIFKHNGKYYMAYTANELIAIAESDSPMGPFTQQTKQELPHTTGQIDPFVFIDDDGRKYLYYVRFDGGNTLYVNELQDDLQSFKPGTLKKCLGAEEGWELTRSFNDSRITEGPTVIKDGGYYYLLYSANDYQDINYAVGYAYSTSPTGPWKKTGRPFLSRHNTGLNGTGHGDLFRDADGQWYYVFHVHQSNSQVHSRRTAIVPITMTDDPENKFIPQTDRMFILSTDASPSERIPEPADIFWHDGIRYSVSNPAKRYVQVESHDPVLFGGYEGELTLPATVEHNGEQYEVKTLGAGTFYNCHNLRRVTLPEGILQLGTGAFENSAIRSIEIPSTVTGMGYLSFKDCNQLRDVIVNRTSVPNIGSDLFPAETFNDGKLWVPAESAEKYKEHKAWGTFKRISGVLSGKVKYDFEADGLYYAILSETESTAQLTAQTNQWASYCQEEITVPQTVENDGQTYNVTQIDTGCFYDCRLVKSITLPEGILRLGSSSFYNCYELGAITIPSTVTELGRTVFRYCDKLQEITCLCPTPPTANAADFSAETLAGTLRVPIGTKALYAQAPGWKEFQNICELEDTPILQVASPASQSSPSYNLAGQKVDPSYRGIVITAGRKVLRK